MAVCTDLHILDASYCFKISMKVSETSLSRESLWSRSEILISKDCWLSLFVGSTLT